MIAAEMGHSRVVAMLLTKGASVSIANDEGFTALHLGAREGNLAVISLLVNADSDLEATTSNGAAALHLAVLQHGYPEVISALIEAGANPNNRGSTGETPLYVAAMQGRVEAVKVLLGAKADPLLPFTGDSGYRLLPLDEAAGEGHAEVVRELIKQVGIKGCGGDSEGLQALTLASRRQHMEIVRMLTAVGVVDTGEALIHSASHVREAAVKFLLLQHRRPGAFGGSAYLNARDPHFGKTALVCAIESAGFSSPRIARMLLDAGADSASSVRFRDARASGASAVFNDTPLSLTVRMLHEKRIRDGESASEKNLNSLEAIRRLLLRVDAVRAVSWLWPCDPSCTVHAAADGPPRIKAISPLLGAMLPILRRRTRRRGGSLLANALLSG